MKPVENWKAILKGAWSVRLAAIASILISISESASFVPTGIFGITPELVADGASTFKYLGWFFYAAGAFAARFINQGIADAQIQAALDAAKGQP